MILNKLAEAFSLSVDEVMKKLNLNSNATSKEIAKALDVYGLFQDKTEIENYVKSKVQNKISEIEKLSSELEEAKTNSLNLETEKTNITDKFNKLSAQLKNNLKSEFVKLGYSDKLNFDSIDLNLFDFSNLQKSISSYAKDNSLAPEKIIEPNNIVAQEDFKSNTFNNVQAFEIGAKRSK